jgi:hypothetical protein
MGRAETMMNEYVKRNGGMAMRTAAVRRSIIEVELV